jgi:hypothetical protein
MPCGTDNLATIQEREIDKVIGRCFVMPRVAGAPEAGLTGA